MQHKNIHIIKHAKQIKTNTAYRCLSLHGLFHIWIGYHPETQPRADMDRGIIAW